VEIGANHPTLATEIFDFVHNVTQDMAKKHTKSKKAELFGILLFLAQFRRKMQSRTNTFSKK